ncbi:MAG TPA: hypothetical protein VF502_16335 [Stellaceae bacterium]
MIARHGAARDLGRRYTPALSLLLLLFCIRVAAQLIQRGFDLPFLPRFDAWHSGTLPYGLLVASQFLIIGVCLWLIVRIHQGTLGPGPRRHVVVLALGAIYFAAMAFRLVAGSTFLAGHAWFATRLPAIFHIVLASFVLTVGHYLWRRALADRRDSQLAFTRT